MTKSECIQSRHNNFDKKATNSPAQPQATQGLALGLVYYNCARLTIMDKRDCTYPNTTDTAMEVEEFTKAPVLQRNFKSTSTGSMVLVGMRERKPARVSEFESQFRQPEEKTSAVGTLKEAFTKSFAKFSFKQSLWSHFPILEALGGYNVLSDLPLDVVAGLTSGIMMIPQGLAFASLSTLEPITGLYISLFSSLTYVLLGTGQQTSYGCIAILSIMMGSILDKFELSLKQGVLPIACGPIAETTASPLTLVNATTVESLLTTAVNSSSAAENGTLAGNADQLSRAVLDLAEKKLQVAGSVTLLCGLIFIVLGKVGFGKVTVFMSDSLVAGVTVGAAFHVGSSQLKTIFGLNFLPRYDGIFKLMKLWFYILKNIHHSNLASVIAAAICMLLIYLFKKYVNDKYKSKLRVPVPIELFVLVLATLVTYFGNLNEKFNISIVEDVPVGVPMPSLPDLSLGVDYLMDGIIIFIVAFAQTVSLAKLMGVKHNYSVDSDQEMFALGMVNVVCSMFSGYVAGASVSRTVVQDGAGGKTQIASLFAAALVLLVMLFIGPYFYHVPKIALSAIIIVSLQSLMLHLLTIPDMWHKSKVDCLIFSLTVICTVVLDADLGLLVGIVVSVFLVLIRSMKCSVDVTTHIVVEGINFWRSADKYYGKQETSGIKVVRINFPLYFVNAEIITNEIFNKTGFNPLKVKIAVAEVKVPPCSAMKLKPKNGLDRSKRENTVNSSAMVDVKQSRDETGDLENGGTSVDEVQNESSELLTTVVSDQVPNGFALDSNHSRSKSFSTLILDLTMVAFIDLMGVKALEFVITKYKDSGVTVYMTNVSENCLDTFQRSGFMSKHGVFVFLTVEMVLQHMNQNHEDQTTENTRL